MREVSLPIYERSSKVVGHEPGWTRCEIGGCEYDAAPPNSMGLRQLFIDPPSKHVVGEVLQIRVYVSADADLEAEIAKWIDRLEIIAPLPAPREASAATLDGRHSAPEDALAAAQDYVVSRLGWLRLAQLALGRAGTRETEASLALREEIAEEERR